MQVEKIKSGGFTLPGEAGYEKLTLELAKKWGADVIRDSDGTVLSDEIKQAGYGIYSTVCIIRDHNEWAKKNMDKLQQTVLMSDPIVATGNSLEVDLLSGYFREQFAINDSEESIALWQVFDRTENRELSLDCWTYQPQTGTVTITGIKPFHKYTVNFFAWRIWEEISMYNHITNNWSKEHLMQLDPAYPEVREYFRSWLENWCIQHPETTVVRFTSLFYNFTWIWGEDIRNRNRFADWASYDFTVCPALIKQFENKYKYRITSEDFINQGKLHSTHSVADQKKLDWMAFIGDVVIQYAKKLIDIVHNHGKQAYVFYDDSWIGLEPYSSRFHEFGFDGIIKCVFSGYEARLGAGVDASVHELRLHPYLFPVGLGGAPTFSKCGNPTKDAAQYWVNVRRALLRQPVERIGLGGYLHLVEQYPDFCDYIESVANEFRLIRELHAGGKPYALKPHVGILHAWGKLRSWTLSGHFHETDSHDLIHILEALSGLPLEVEFLSFADILNGGLDKVDILINAGYQDSAWSGGDHWGISEVVTTITRWVHNSGVFIGVNEPSATNGFDTKLRLAHLMGVDIDNGNHSCQGRWTFKTDFIDGLVPNEVSLLPKSNVFLTDGKAQVLIEKDRVPVLTMNTFGSGKGIYMSSFQVSHANTRLLLNLILSGVSEPTNQDFLTDNPATECAWYPQSGILAIINNSGEPQTTVIGGKTYHLPPYIMITEKK